MKDNKKRDIMYFSPCGEIIVDDMRVESKSYKIQ